MCKCFVLVTESCAWHILTIMEIATQGMLQACVLVTVMGNDYGTCIFPASVVGRRGACKQRVRGGLQGEGRLSRSRACREDALTAGWWVRVGMTESPHQVGAAV